MNVGRRLGSLVMRMYGHLSRKTDHGITGVLLVAGLALLILAVRSATDRWFFLSLALFALSAGWLRVWNPRNGPTFVEEVRQSHVEVHEGETVDRRTLSALGGRRGFITPWLWTFAAPDERALAEVFTGLRDAGVHFSSEGSHSWGPAEVFEELRKNDLVSGSYKKRDEF